MANIDNILNEVDEKLEIARLEELVNTFELPGGGTGGQFLEIMNVEALFYKYAEEDSRYPHLDAVIDYRGFVKALEEYKESIEDYVARNVLQK